MLKLICATTLIGEARTRPSPPRTQPALLCAAALQVANFSLQLRGMSSEVLIPIDKGIKLAGTLTMPDEYTEAVVIFAHGSGSSRFSPRNRYVSSEINKSGVATLLFDLLTPEEEQVDDYTREHRFDIPLLAHRLNQTVGWLEQNQSTKAISKNIGLFGASTGGGAALMSAAALGPSIKAVVSRGGRPDLAGAENLHKITCPTLLLVGGHDTEVIKLNRRAFDQLQKCPAKEIKIIPGATHLFEEPGTLEQVAHTAAKFFQEHLVGAAQPSKQA